MSIEWEYVLWAGTACIVSFLVSLAIVVAVVIHLPANYFLDGPRRALWVDRHPAVRMALLVGKNVLGFAIILAGAMLSLPGIPGQGILTILIGLLLIDFPGKRRLEYQMVRRPRIRAAIDAIRQKFGKPPLQLEEE